jgi:hypothetical protein
VKLSIYLLSLAAEDIMTQQQGLVMITKLSAKITSHCSVKDTAMDQKVNYSKFLESIPLRYTADHIWMSSTGTMNVIPENSNSHMVARGLVIMPLGKALAQQRKNARLHTGKFILNSG